MSKKTNKKQINRSAVYMQAGSKNPVSIMIVSITFENKPKTSLLTITPNSITCRYDSETNDGSEDKWVFTTSDADFREQFYYVVEILENMIEVEEPEFIMPEATRRVIITYKNRPKLERAFWVPSAFFTDLSAEIIRMLPQSFEIPGMLVQPEDDGKKKFPFTRDNKWEKRGEITARDGALAKVIAKLQVLSDSKEDKHFTLKEIEQVVDEVRKNG